LDNVALALILALDGSASVTFEEFNLLAGGCAAGLRDPDVVAGLTAGGALAAVLLWSGHGAQEVMVDWTAIRTEADAAAFAEAVENIPRVVRAGETAIGEALIACAHLLDALPAATARRVIDIAGDGRSNDGPPPGPIRDSLAEAGVTINGLCVVHEEPDLLESYSREVIGGPGAFVLQCQDYAGFAAAMRAKLQREIAAVGSDATASQARSVLAKSSPL
jgi:hypothetical protein